MGEWQCGGVAMWGSGVVEELRCGGDAVRESRGVWESRYGDVVVWGCCSVLDLQ